MNCGRNYAYAFANFPVSEGTGTRMCHNTSASQQLAVACTLTRLSPPQLVRCGTTSAQYSFTTVLLVGLLSRSAVADYDPPPPIISCCSGFVYIAVYIHDLCFILPPRAWFPPCHRTLPRGKAYVPYDMYIVYEFARW